MFPRLKNGLATHVFDAMRKYPEEMKALFVSANLTVTAESVEHVFQPVYSEPGSNRHRVELTVVYWWADFPLELEGLYHFNQA